GPFATISGGTANYTGRWQRKETATMTAMFAALRRHESKTVAIYLESLPDASTVRPRHIGNASGTLYVLYQTTMPRTDSCIPRWHRSGVHPQRSGSVERWQMH